jgi:hypothetical protein
MLNLAVAQIEMSMKEGDDSVDTLTNVFTTTAGRVQAIEKLMEQVECEEAKEVMDQCQKIAQDTQYSILAFQFYDKLTQRLSHVSHSLDALGDLVGDSSRIYNPIEWTLLQEKIKSKYTMSAEKEMFDLIMKGDSVEDIVKSAPQHQHSETDVELF